MSQVPTIALDEADSAVINIPSGPSPETVRRVDADKRARAQRESKKLGSFIPNARATPIRIYDRPVKQQPSKLSPAQARAKELRIAREKAKRRPRTMAPAGV